MSLQFKGNDLPHFHVLYIYHDCSQQNNFHHNSFAVHKNARYTKGLFIHISDVPLTFHIKMRNAACATEREKACKKWLNKWGEKQQ